MGKHDPHPPFENPGHNSPGDDERDMGPAIGLIQGIACALPSSILGAAPFKQPGKCHDWV